MEKEDPCCLPPASSAPWFVYTQASVRDEKVQTFCTFSSSPPYFRYFLKSIPQLCGKQILSSNDGWFLLRHLDNLKLFTVWNPVSSRVIHLPPLNALEDGVVELYTLICPRSEDGDGGDVNVLVFVDGLAFSYRPSGDSNSWIAQTTELNGKRARVKVAVTCNGVIYGNANVSTEDGGFRVYFVLVEVSDRDGYLTLRLLANAPRAGFTYSSGLSGLVASCGKVYTVRVDKRFPLDRGIRICAVSVWEFDLCSSTWVRIKCLGGRAFLLGPRVEAWCWGNTDHNGLGGVRQNSVYLHFPKSQAIYIYSLDDCSLTSLLPCPRLPSPPSMSTWFMPRYHRVGENGVHEYCIEKIHLLKVGSKALHCQELQESNERHGQHSSCKSELQGSWDAFCLTLGNQKQNDMPGEVSLCKLPLHLIALVAERMHLFDYANFRAACKGFRSIAPVARWRTNNSYPLLMFFESEEPLCRLMDPCRSDSHYIVMPEWCKGIVYVVFSKDGWLLVQANKGYSLHFFNPFTGVKGEYPLLPYLNDFSSLGFSTCPTTSDCVTVAIDYYSLYDGDVVIHYHCFGDEMWRECMFQQHDEINFEGPLLTSPVYYEGAFYFLGQRGCLAVFRLVDEVGTWEVHDKPETLGDDIFHSSHLVECDGQILSIFIGDMGKWIQISRFDQKKRKWVQIESLGNHVLFLSRASSFSMAAREPEMANRIYLPRRCGNGVLFYALDTGKYSILAGDKSFYNFSGTKEHGRCFWI